MFCVTARRTFALGLALLALAAPAAVAQAPDPLELARGLRGDGQAELALDYLAELQAKKPPSAVLALLPLERALARLDLAAAEGDEARRASLVAGARADFDAFLAGNVGHPRRPEAAAALARLVNVQAKAQLARGQRGPEKGRPAELIKARALFADAAKRFEQSAGEFNARRSQPDVMPTQKRKLDAEYAQAKLDQGGAILASARSYTTNNIESTNQRTKLLDEAQKVFADLAKEDANQPLCWVAKAWVGECYREATDPKRSADTFAEVGKAAAANPAAAAGLRQVRFFEARAEYERAFADANRGAAFRRAQTLIEAWLADVPRGAVMTPELAAARFYLAYAKDQQGRALVKIDPKTMQPSVPDAARELFRAAERDYRRVLAPENDYTPRAVEARSDVVRLLIGDPDKVDPAAEADFERVLMTAQVQLYRLLNEDKPEAEQAALAGRVVALYERLDQLAVPRELAADALDARVSLVYVYLLAGRPYQAAVLGEHLGRTLRKPASAARAAYYALQGYRQSAALANPADAQGRAADADKALRLGLFLDKDYPQESSTDMARVLVAQQLLQAGRAKEAFEISSRVTAAGPRFANGRFLESLAAAEMLRSTPDAPSKLPEAERAALIKRTLADLAAVPDPAPGATADEARVALLVQLQRAEMHFFEGVGGLAKAEQVAVAVAKKVEAAKSLSPEEARELTMRAELGRLRAIYGQALTSFQAKNYPEATAKLAPVIADALKSGPLAKPGDATPGGELAKKADEFRRDKLVGLAIQARVGEGAVDKVADLLDALKKLGGNLASSAGPLGQLVEGVRPRLDSLRKEGKAAEADKLAKAVGGVLDRVAAEPGVQPATLIVLGRGLRDLGDFDKSAEFLKRVPAPPAGNPDPLKTRLSDLPEPLQGAARHYKLAQLELARSYRAGKKFAEAEATLKDPVGGTKDNPGWPSNLDFRREAAMLLEARAAAAPAAEATKLWGEANKKWGEMANVYLSPLRKIQAGRKDARSAVLALLELKQLPAHPKMPAQDAEVRKGLGESKQPAWVAELLSDATPAGKEYGQTLQNTLTRMEGDFKPQYHDLLFESYRCLTAANQQLLKSNPAELSKKLDGVAKAIVAVETSNPDLSDAVAGRFRQLLADNPALADAYRRQSGKKFAKPPA